MKKPVSVRAWAVFFRGRKYWLGREGNGHALIYDNKLSAEIRANLAPHFEIREVSIRPLRPKRKRS